MGWLRAHSVRPVLAVEAGAPRGAGDLAALRLDRAGVEYLLLSEPGEECAALRVLGAVGEKPVETGRGEFRLDRVPDRLARGDRGYLSASFDGEGEGSSSTSRTLRVRPAALNGLPMNRVPESSVPWCTMALSV